jgi:hypothetical protein
MEKEAELRRLGRGHSVKYMRFFKFEFQNPKGEGIPDPKIEGLVVLEFDYSMLDS